MLAIDGHELVAQRVVARMQAHGERNRAVLGELVHLADEARRGDGDAAAGEPVAVVVKEDVQSAQNVVEVLQRLAHPHEHDVGDDSVVGVRHACVAAQFAFGPPELAHDLGGREVAVEALLARGAEEAAHGAPRLRGDAERAAVILWNEHRFDRVSVADVKEPLARAVSRLLLGDGHGRTHFGHVLQLGSEHLREVRHVVEVAFDMTMEPARELSCTEGLFADAGAPSGEPFQIEVEKVHLRGGGRLFDVVGHELFLTVFAAD